MVGGGSDLLQLMKERTITPDVVINLKPMRSLDHITREMAASHRRPHDPGDGRAQCGLRPGVSGADGSGRQRRDATDSQRRHDRRQYFTATLVLVFRNNFPCLKNGGRTCFSVNGENEFHAILGGGPS